MMTNMYPIVLLTGIMAASVSPLMAGEQGPTMEYDLYLPHSKSKGVADTLLRIDEYKAQARYHAHRRDEAIAYCRQSRARENKAYWFFEAVEEDSRRILIQIRLVRLAYSLQPEQPTDQRLQQLKTPKAKAKVQGLQRTIGLIRGLLIEAGEDTWRVDMVDQNLTNLLNAAEQNHEVKEQSRSSAARKKAHFQSLAEEYVRIRRQLMKFISKEPMT